MALLSEWLAGGGGRASAAAFVENLGQWNRHARYRAALGGDAAGSGGLELWLTDAGYVYVLRGPAEPAAPPARAARVAAPVPDPDGGGDRRTHAVVVRWVGASRPTMAGTGPIPGAYNWLVGGPLQVVRGARAYRRVVAHGVYPGIDAWFDASAGGGPVETGYMVAAGVDPGRIVLALDGAESVTVDGAGGLVITTPLGVVRESRPVVYQVDAGGRRTDLPASFEVVGGRVRFAVSGRDRDRPLLIDPRVTFSRSAGGAAGDYVMAAGEDDHGLYVAGVSLSGDLPTTGGAVQPDSRGSWDWWVSKLDRGDGSPLWTTYLGSAASDRVADLEVLPDGSVLLVGTTAGTGDFGGATPAVPAHSGPGSGDRIVVAHLDSSGTALLRVVRFGAQGDTTAFGLARSPSSGDWYVLGRTTAACATAGACGLGPAGGLAAVTATPPDGFVVRLSGDLSTASALTFLGGDAADALADAVVDPSGAVFAVGATSSTRFPVPVTGLGPLGGGDLMVAKLTPDLDAALYVARIGGTGPDAVVTESPTDLLFGLQGWHPIAVDAAGRAYVLGTSASIDYPIAGSPDQTANRGNYDLVVSRLSADGAAIDRSRYLGGGSTDVGRALRLDSAGNVVVVAASASIDFPVTIGAVQSHNAGNYDLAIAILTGDLGRLRYGTYWGGRSTDWGVALGLGPAAGQVRACGDTYLAADGFPRRPDDGAAGAGGSYDVGVLALDASGTDLTATKTGAFAAPSNWTVQVSNLGVGDAVFAPGDTILLDNLPAAIYGLPEVRNTVNVEGADAIACAVVGADLTCAAAGAAVTLVGNASFDVVVRFVASSSGLVTNPRPGGVCRVDPDGVVTSDVDLANNSAAPVQGAVSAGGVPAVGSRGLVVLWVAIAAAGMTALLRRALARA